MVKKRLKKISIDWGFLIGMPLLIWGFCQRDPWKFALGATFLLAPNTKIEVEFD